MKFCFTECLDSLFTCEWVRHWASIVQHKFTGILILCVSWFNVISESVYVDTSTLPPYCFLADCEGNTWAWTLNSSWQKEAYTLISSCQDIRAVPRSMQLHQTILCHATCPWRLVGDCCSYLWHLGHLITIIQYPRFVLIFFPVFRYLTMRIMTAGHQMTGFPWAVLKDHLIGNLFLQKPCCLQMTKILLVQIVLTNIISRCSLH